MEVKNKESREEDRRGGELFGRSDAFSAGEFSCLAGSLLPR